VGQAAPVQVGQRLSRAGEPVGGDAGLQPAGLLQAAAQRSVRIERCHPEAAAGGVAEIQDRDQTGVAEVGGGAQSCQEGRGREIELRLHDVDDDQLPGLAGPSLESGCARLAGQ